MSDYLTPEAHAKAERIEAMHDDDLDIYGAKEAAAALGVSKARFHELRARPDFPKGTRLANGVVYRGEDIRAYAANRKAT